MNDQQSATKTGPLPFIPTEEIFVDDQGQARNKNGDPPRLLTAGVRTISGRGEEALRYVEYLSQVAFEAGHEVPRGGYFTAGQVFYKNGQVEEVRLESALPGEEGQPLKRWTTPTPPQIAFDGQLLWSPDDEGRAHFSAIIERNSEAPDGFNLWMLFDLRENAQIVQQGAAQPSKLPRHLPQMTFIEARAVTHAISDAQTAKDYRDIEGELAVLHTPRRNGRKSTLQARFQPLPELWTWWGIDNPTKKALGEALKKLNFETNMTFQVTLACLLQTEHARRTFTLDEIIKLIGRDTDARRSSEARQRLRREVWGNILTLASMPLIGARPGVWREPGASGEKRAAMPKQALESRDPLLVITGGRTTDEKEPPKEVSLTAGEWLMPWVESGNREILSDFGDVLKLAHIPRGNTSGAWAACIGLALQQNWREEATKAQKNLVSRGGEEKVEVLKFRPFTRRELLTELFQCDDSPLVILNDPKGRRKRAQEHWKTAVDHLKEVKIIGFYREFPTLETGDLDADWLNQPLDIRPMGENLKNALIIHNAALEAKARGKRSGKRVPREKPVEE